MLFWYMLFTFIFGSLLGYCGYTIVITIHDTKKLQRYIVEFIVLHMEWEMQNKNARVV